MPLLLLNWRLWVAVALAAGLAFSHWKAYSLGQDNVRVEWAEEQIQVARQQAELAAGWAAALQKERDDALKREQVIRRDAAAARAALVGLSDATDAAMRNAESSHAACLVTAAAGAKLLQQCGSDYQGLAEKADRHVNDIRTLIGAWPKATDK